MSIPRWVRLFPVLIAAVAGPAAAAVTPSTLRVPLGETTRATVTWRPAGAFAGGETVTSTAGTFRVLQAGNCAGALRTVTRTLRATADGQGRVRLRERLRVDAALGLAARRAGGSGLCFERTFRGAVSQTQVTETLILPLVGGLGADLALTLVRIRFDDGALARLVTRGARLGIRAEIHYRGEGRLRAVWEIATPDAGSGIAGFRRIGLLQRRLVGDGTLVVEGPRLPTDRTGLYRVRLRFLEPQLDAPELQLRYFVRLPVPAAPPPAPLAVTGPADGAVLTEGLRFGWRRVVGARAFRLEFFAPGDDPRRDPPRTGLLLPAEAEGSALSRLVRARLAERPRWRWRVVAFDAEGRLLAASPLRTLAVE